MLKYAFNGISFSFSLLNFLKVHHYTNAIKCETKQIQFHNNSLAYNNTVVGKHNLQVQLLVHLSILIFLIMSVILTRRMMVTILRLPCETISIGMTPFFSSQKIYVLVRKIVCCRETPLKNSTHQCSVPRPYERPTHTSYLNAVQNDDVPGVVR